MNSTPLLLLPLAAITLLSSKQTAGPVSDPTEAAPSTEQAAVQALTTQLHQATELLKSAGLEGLDQPAHHGHGRSHGEKREIGLHTGHLSTSGLSAPEGENYSGARGLTPAD